MEPNVATADDLVPSYWVGVDEVVCRVVDFRDVVQWRGSKVHTIYAFHVVSSFR